MLPQISSSKSKKNQSNTNIPDLKNATKIKVKLNSTKINSYDFNNGYSSMQSKIRGSTFIKDSDEKGNFIPPKNKIKILSNNKYQYSPQVHSITNYANNPSNVIKESSFNNVSSRQSQNKNNSNYNNFKITQDNLNLNSIHNIKLEKVKPKIMTSFFSLSEQEKIDNNSASKQKIQGINNKQSQSLIKSSTLSHTYNYPLYNNFNKSYNTIEHSQDEMKNLKYLRKSHDQTNHANDVLHKEIVKPLKNSFNTSNTYTNKFVIPSAKSGRSNSMNNEITLNTNYLNINSLNNKKKSLNIETNSNININNNNNNNISTRREYTLRSKVNSIDNNISNINEDIADTLVKTNSHDNRSSTHYKNKQTSRVNNKNYSVNNMNNNGLVVSKYEKELRNFNFDKYYYLNSLTSKKNYGVITAFAYNTHNGTVRNYNEDRVSIHLHVKKSLKFNNRSNNSSIENWPIIHFISVIDGHGGPRCADYLKDNLIKAIVSSSHFPHNINDALREGICLLENDFINNIAVNSQGNAISDFSGACIVFFISIDSEIYVVNLGDSRAISYRNKAPYTYSVTTDHKPDNVNELQRINHCGGSTFVKSCSQNGKLIFGPTRISPGNLSVSRTIGDIYAKKALFGGKPNVVSNEPDIFKLDNVSNYEYLFLASDGVYDCMTNNDITDIINDSINCNPHSIHEALGKANDIILKHCLYKSCSDNITSIIIKLNTN